MNGKTSIVLTGVGGQGMITATNILGKTAVKAKINVYVSEIMVWRNEVGLSTLLLEWAMFQAHSLQRAPLMLL